MSLSTTLATVIIMLTSLTNADRTEGWKISYFSVPYGQVVSHLLLFSLQPPPAEASVGFFVNGHGWTLVKDFTISSQAWHIVDIIQAMKEAALVVSPVAGINQYLKKGRLARVAVRSLQPVHWVFCSYSCELPPFLLPPPPPPPPTPCLTTTTTSITASGRTSLLVAPTTTNTTTTTTITTTTTSTTNLAVLCGLFALTTITLTVYVCMLRKNSKFFNELPDTGGVGTSVSTAPRRSCQQDYLPGVERGAQATYEGNDSGRSKDRHGATDVFSHGATDVFSHGSEGGAAYVNAGAEMEDHSLQGILKGYYNPTGRGDKERGTQNSSHREREAMYFKRSSVHSSENSL
ncbi:uncharacterized protein [Cherax quadricarinatus]|uniref:uncharacterized protein n=1 Tax=Cherax quadricarinatus TaxID=27406 RepID=UPI00387ED431